MDLYRDILRFVIIYIVSAPAYILTTPLRWIFDTFTIKCPDIFRKANNLSNHREKVNRVVAQILEWNARGRTNLLCTARPTWQTLSLRNLNKHKFTQIQINMEDIIEINTEKMILRVEPGMKMGTLTHKLLSLGWTIQVIPEFESLTVGGCVNGTGIETSSHKYGLFADTCVEYEVVMADGSLVTCSKDENSDLFYSIPWSHGTIGFLTGVTIPITPSPRYVKVEYHATESLVVAQMLLKNSAKDFVEGIMFNLDKIVVMYGEMVQDADANQINHINRWYKPWFYKHVETKLNNSVTTVEYIPIRDYYHRHQRSYFWELDSASPMGKQAWFRYLFGWIYPFNFQLVKLLTPESYWDLVFDKKRHILQDFLIPISKMSEILQLSHTELEVYPIWLCPCKFFEKPGLAPLPPGLDDGYIDIGIYGISPKVKNFKIEDKVRFFEKFVTECEGYQFLYADTYMTREEFKAMFKLKDYEKIRQKYNCKNAFPEIYDKISKSARK